MESLSLLDADCSALAGLFQLIVTDLKNSGPMWEDLILRTTKLHHSLKSTLVAFSAFLDTFQRIADAATGTRGATKDVGAALTRLTLRHRAIESRVKSFTNSLVEYLVNPLQEKLDEWRRTNHVLDKEHTKEYKKTRSDIKKKTEYAARLHKKAKKAGKNSQLNKILDSTLTDLASRYVSLQETERTALRNALTEERSRYCAFSIALKPVLAQEVDLINELGHLKEVMGQLEKHSADPNTLPPASEQVLEDIKSGDVTWTWKTPPSSPTSSLGSRKSSMCSISSINSSSSSSTHSPSHNARNRSASQGLRLVSVASQDSGFTSQDALYRHIPIMPSHFTQASGLSDHSGGSDGSQTPSPATQTTATWPNLTDPLLQHKSASATGLHTLVDRPHTISSAYERGRDRPPLTVYTFQPPDGGGGGRSGPVSPQISSQPVSPVCLESERGHISPLVSHMATISRRPSRTSLQQLYVSSSSQESLAGTKSKPPLPMRCSSLERPSIPEKKASIRQRQRQQQQQQHQLLLQLQQKQQELQQKEPDKQEQQIDLLKQVHLKNAAYGSNSNLQTDDPQVVPDFNRPAPDMILPQPVYSNMAKLQAELQMRSQAQVQSTQDSPLSESFFESDGGSSHGSLSSSGYGSQPNMSLDHVTRLEDCEASKYCTLRPHSLAVVPQSLLLSSQELLHVSGQGSPRCGSLRRGQKPPPPVRRTSSISSTSSLSMSTFPSNLTASLSNASISSSASTVLSSPLSSRSIKGVNGVSTSSSSNESSTNVSPHQKTDSESSTPVGSLENLPPPPAFLLEEGTHSLDDHQEGIDADNTTPEGIPCGPPQPIKDECLQQRKGTVSQTVKALQETRHQPVSPVSVRRSQSARLPQPTAVPLRAMSIQNDRRISLQDTRAALMSSLNARLSLHNPPMAAPHTKQVPPPVRQPRPAHPQRGNGSPKMQRAKLTALHEDVPIGIYSQAAVPRLHSECLTSTFSSTQTRSHNSNSLTSHTIEYQNYSSGGSMEIRTSPILKNQGQQKFLQSLNMVLSQRTDGGGSPQPSSPKMKGKKKSQGGSGGAAVQRSGSSSSDKSSKVRQWISSKAGMNTESTGTAAALRESLLDQIRRGTPLKRARHIHDRSAPRVH